MIDANTRNAALLHYQRGLSKSEISRLLGISRTTLDRIIGTDGVMPVHERDSQLLIDEELLRRLYEECEGYAQRVMERLAEEHDIKVGYSTLTRQIRSLDLSREGAEPKRCARVEVAPGVEMQHDTTTYNIMIGDKKVKFVASIIYFRYCKMRYLKFYHTFDRFRLKCFLHEALMHFGYSAKVCVIDNTNLARLRGTGYDAIMAAEMASFSRIYGFRFLCHAINHPNRKAGNERAFYTTETNFLPGRRFADLDDLNRQAFIWATEKFANRPQSKTGLVPARAFEAEQCSLTKLPPDLPAPYRPVQRKVDAYGYIPFDANYYWVPGEDLGVAKVLEYDKHIAIYKHQQLLAEYRLPSKGTRLELFHPEGFEKPKRKPRGGIGKDTKYEEKILKEISPIIVEYLAFLKDQKGIQRNRLIRYLHSLSVRVTTDIFVATIKRALQYRISDRQTIEEIAELILRQDEHIAPQIVADGSLKDRPSYQEGFVTDTPDMEGYDTTPEDEDENYDG
jgi:hypothetical protein